MSVSDNDLSGFILAGGKSSRFGSDKALARIEGKTMISYSIDLLKPFCQTICVNKGDKDDYSYPEVYSISDLIPGIGPMGGIYSCLKTSETNYNLILTCDMPYISSDLLDNVINIWYKKKQDITICKNKEGKLFPFPGIYSKECIPVLRQLILNQDYKMMNLIKQMHISEYLLSESDERKMANFNYADPFVFD